MAKKKFVEESSSGGADWITTYSDTVTLILCFFVLLFSFSTINEQKWKEIVEAFADKGTGEGISMVSSLDVGSLSSGMDEGETPNDILYNTVKDYIKNHHLSNKVQLEKGDRTVTLRFRDTVLFDPDSTVLREDGKKVLGDISKLLNDTIRLINSIQIEGHTAANRKGEPKFINTFEFSAERALRVLNHVWKVEGLPAKKLRAVGYGQYHPIASNEDENKRKQNRRVEFVISSVEHIDNVIDISATSSRKNVVSR